MKAHLRVVYAALVLLLGGCPTDEELYRPIAAGIYYGKDGQEYLEVSDSKIYFHVEYRAETPVSGYIDQWHKYRIREAHIIYITKATNWVAVDFGAYNWYWIDNKILRINTETGKTVWYIRPDSLLQGER